MGVVNYFCIDGELISETRNGVESDYIPDTLGNTLKLVNMSGAVTDEFEYWPYGELRSHTGTSATPFTFGGTLGYYSDPWGGEYVRARELDAVRVSWMSMDPLWPEELAFVYGKASPLSYVDPSGLGCSAAQIADCKRRFGARYIGCYAIPTDVRFESCWPPRVGIFYTALCVASNPKGPWKPPVRRPLPPTSINPFKGIPCDNLCKFICLGLAHLPHLSFSPGPGCEATCQLGCRTLGGK
jgi:RHS repeat-associated protein